MFTKNGVNGDFVLLGKDVSKTCYLQKNLRPYSYSAHQKASENYILVSGQGNVSYFVVVSHYFKVLDDLIPD